MNLSRIIERWAEHFPSKTALHFQGSDVSYRNLWNRIRQAADSLNVNPGDRVAWLGYNAPDMLVLLFALARRGAILVPLNWRLTAAEHRTILEDCKPRWIFHDGNFDVKDLGIPVGNLGKAKDTESRGEDKN